MTELTNWLQAHQVLATAIFWTIISNLISALPAPTKDSTAKYLYLFRFANGVLAGNLARAASTSLEKSPNYMDAIEKHVETLKAQGNV